ncbi:porphobilinogen synthase [Caldicellulosiruptoraceae bacterium PP1]
MYERLRRLRSNKNFNEMFYSLNIRKSQLIYPLFVCEGKDVLSYNQELDDIVTCSIDKLDYVLEKASKHGIKSFLLFGVYKNKIPNNDFSNYLEENIIQKAATYIKENLDSVVIADVCLCGLTHEGHCGIINNNEIDNDKSIEILGDISVSYVKHNVDIVAPSSMMDGQVYAIRKKLDENGFNYTPIMSYSTKFASSLYNPFRDVALSSPRFGDRTSYQLNPFDLKGAINEALADQKEGADILMVKPALMYLDVLQKMKQVVSKPVAAYIVSGEYAMIKAGANKGYIDELKTVRESFTSLIRAGADIIITYHALKVAEWIDKGVF